MVSSADAASLAFAARRRAEGQVSGEGGSTPAAGGPVGTGVRHGFIVAHGPGLRRCGQDPGEWRAVMLGGPGVPTRRP